MADEFGEKTEAPTPRKRQEAREEGNIARSSDLSAAIMLLGAVLLLGVFGRRMFAAMVTLVEATLGPSAGQVLTIGDIGPLVTAGVHLGVQILMPVALGILALGIAANMLQVGFVVTGKPLVPKFSKISPVKGLKQIFSMRGLVRFIMSMLKVAAIGGFAAALIIQDWPAMLALIHLESQTMLAAAATLVWSLALKIAAVLLVLAILDFSYQKWQYEQDLKMSKQEIKEEFKRMEGDPLVKQRRARVARQLAMQRMAYDVPKADVIVSNPTHFAVALKYDGDMGAPKVIAKGADYMALRIRQIAAANDIPIVERPPLARGLYRHVQVGQEIPSQYYTAVAEILAYVYRLSGRKIA